MSQLYSNLAIDTSKAMREEAIAEYKENIDLIKSIKEIANEEKLRKEQEAKERLEQEAQVLTKTIMEELRLFLAEKATNFAKTNNENKYYASAMKLLVANSNLSFKTRIELADYKNRVDPGEVIRDEYIYMCGRSIYFIVYELHYNPSPIHTIDAPDSLFHNFELSLEYYKDCERNERLSSADRKYLCEKTYCGVRLYLSLPSSERQNNCCMILPACLTNYLNKA